MLKYKIHHSVDLTADTIKGQLHGNENQ